MPGTKRPHGDQERARPAEEGEPFDYAFVVLRARLEARLHSRGTGAGDPVEGAIADHGSKRARDDHGRELERALRGDDGGRGQRGLTGEDGHDRIGEHEAEDGEIGGELVLEVGDEPQGAFPIEQREDDSADDGQEDRRGERDDEPEDRAAAHSSAACASMQESAGANTDWASPEREFNGRPAYGGDKRNTRPQSTVVSLSHSQLLNRSRPPSGGSPR